jgi:hypothetical protein
MPIGPIPTLYCDLDLNQFGHRHSMLLKAPALSAWFEAQGSTPLRRPGIGKSVPNFIAPVRNYGVAVK